MWNGWIVVAAVVATAAAGRDTEGRNAVTAECAAGRHAPTSVGPTQIPNLPYFDGPDADPDKHRLDLYLPGDAHSVPALIWIHGGAWVVGGRADEAALATRLAAQGIAVAAISHRLSPGTWMDPWQTEGVQHPAHVIDCARAVAWLHANAERFGIDRERIFVGGYSSGGHLAALLATDPTYLNDVGLPADALRGAIPMAGTYDLASYYQDHLRENGQAMADAHVLDTFGDQVAELPAASPATYVGSAGTPMLVISETDTYEFTRVFEEVVASTARDDVEFLHVRDLDHAGLYRSISRDERDPTFERMVEYLKQ